MRFRRGWPLALLLVLLVAVPTLEIWLIIQVGDAIGLWPTVGLLVAEALVGGWLVRREGGRTWRALSTALTTGRVPTGELADAALVLVGGLLLVLPGFLTDILGFLVLLPLTRPLARRVAAFFIARQVRGLTAPGGQHRAGGTVIEGETVEGPGAGPETEPRVVTGEAADR